MAIEPTGSEPVASIGIIGGGKVGLQLLKLYSESTLTRVVFIVDREAAAPAVVAARAKAIATFTDIQRALSTFTPDFIFEVTGSAQVLDLVSRAISHTSSQLITHAMAFVILRVLEENRQLTAAQVVSEISGIKTEIVNSLASITSTLGDIKRTTSDLHYLSLNARIEAARAGENGHGFDVVAQEVEKSAKAVQQMAKEIERVNANILSISGRIEGALQKFS